MQTYSKLGYIQRFVHAPKTPFGKHLSKVTIQAHTDGRNSGHVQGRLGIQTLGLLHLTAHAVIVWGLGSLIILAGSDIPILYLRTLILHTVKVVHFRVHPSLMFPTFVLIDLLM